MQPLTSRPGYGEGHPALPTAASKEPSKAQLDYAKHLVKQVGGDEPDWAKMDQSEVSSLIDGLKTKRGKPVWYGNGQFSHWEKKDAQARLPSFPQSNIPDHPPNVMAVAELPGGGPSDRGLPVDDALPGQRTFAKPEDDIRTPQPKDEPIERVDGPDNLTKDRDRVDTKEDNKNTGPDRYSPAGPWDSTDKTPYPYRDDKPNTHNAMALRVARTFLAETENVRRLEALIADMMEPLGQLDGWHPPKEDEKREALSRRLGEAAKKLYDEAVFIFEDEARGKLQEKTTHMRRFKNFRKIILDFSKVRTWEDAQEALKKHQTKSNYAREKVNEYAREAINVLKYFDSSIETTLTIEDYTVTLVNTGRQEWAKDDVVKLREVLAQTNRLLGKAGLGAATGGRVFAWPTTQLSGAAKGSAGAQASYHIPTNTVKVAVGGPLKETVHSMVHELGHRVYFKTLGGGGRSAWEEWFGANVQPPDLDAIFKKWDAWRASGDWEAEKYGGLLGHFMAHLKHAGDDDTLMWLNLIGSNFKIDEQLDPMTGAPKKGTVPGYDQIKAKANEIKVFLYPVSAYSGKDAHELFAETLAYLLVDGPSRVPEILRDAFSRAVPKIKVAEEAEFVTGLYLVASAPEMFLPAESRIAADLPEIENKLSPEIEHKGKACRASLRRADLKNLRWIFSVNCGNGPKVVRLKANRSGNVVQFPKLNLHLACSCPAWRWQGPEYHAKQQDYQDPNTPFQGTASAPNIRDPKRVHKVCKHVQAVLSMTRNWTLPASGKMKRK